MRQETAITHLKNHWHGILDFFKYLTDLRQHYTFDLTAVKRAIFDHLAQYSDDLTFFHRIYDEDVTTPLQRISSDTLDHLPPLTELREFSTSLATSKYCPKVLHLPPSIFQFTQLHTLNVIQPDPGFLSQLDQFPQLKVVRLQGDTIDQLPPAIFNLRYERFDVLWTSVSEFPMELCDQSTLKHLHITSTPIPHMPEEIGNLTQLKSLYLENIPLRSLPATIYNCRQLEELTITGMPELTTWPAGLEKLQQLKLLQITDTGITRFPAEVGELPQLEVLYTGRNVELPRTILQLKGTLKKFAGGPDELGEFSIDGSGEFYYRGGVGRYLPAGHLSYVFNYIEEHGYVDSKNTSSHKNLFQ